ncbi:hypothetical protein EXS71_00645 [Candidatus Uhrbacteria bacterium]|nr:hypothetical protein [Candidatus Uhrbacteria bacterium]
MPMPRSDLERVRQLLAGLPQLSGPKTRGPRTRLILMLMEDEPLTATCERKIREPQVLAWPHPNEPEYLGVGRFDPQCRGRGSRCICFVRFREAPNQAFSTVYRKDAHELITCRLNVSPIE